MNQHNATPKRYGKNEHRFGVRFLNFLFSIGDQTDSPIIFPLKGFRVYREKLKHVSVHYTKGKKNPLQMANKGVIQFV